MVSSKKPRTIRIIKFGDKTYVLSSSKIFLKQFREPRIKFKNLFFKLNLDH